MPEPKGIQLAGFNVAVVIAGILFLCFALNGGTVYESQAAIKLQSRINPNDAPAASLARLPGIGITKANAIVEYRRQFQKSGQDDFAFKDCNDLRNIKGIGPVTAENMCEWLRFN
ncbi:MAG: helix-hairpin-helix domain-containing protein [Sedimentisphaerales bacterium]